MIYNHFGTTAMNVSRVALGAFLLGKPDADEPAVARIIDESLHAGINLIDTADSYFESEARVGRALAANKKRDQIFLCSKLYNQHTAHENAARNGRANILRGIDQTLRKLQTDHLDIYLLHHPDSHAPVDETLRTLDSLVKAGKTRYIGASNHYAWQIAHAHHIAEQLNTEPFTILQNCYNLLWRTLETEHLHFVRNFNFAQMVYSPLGLGLLTNDFQLWSEGQVPKPAAAYLKSPASRASFDTMRSALIEIAAELKLSLSQLAILWLMAKPAVSTALLGASEPGQITEITAIIDQQLPPEILTRIDTLTQPAVHLPYRNQPETTGGIG